MRVNIFSGILSTLVLVGAHQVTGGDAEKLFTTVLGLAISTTLVSYLGIFPALAVLRRKLPGVKRGYRAPAASFLSIWLTLLILFATGGIPSISVAHATRALIRRFSRFPISVRLSAMGRVSP